MIGLVLVALGCGRSGEEPDGEQLARTHCAGCHLFPEPALLDRAGWAGVLPEMGHRLGVYTTTPRDSLIAPLIASAIDPAPIYPPAPAVTPAEWAALRAYYHAAAPETLEETPRREPTVTVLPGFEVRVPGLRFDPPLTTLVAVDETDGVFYVGNYGRQSRLLALDRTGGLVHQYALPGAPVAVARDGRRLLVLVVGRGPEPSEASGGQLLAIEEPGGTPRLLIGGLKRPVDFAVGDLNEDGRADLVVCEYGHQAGALAWYEHRADGTYRRHVLHAAPGAVETAIHDLDGDGQPDIAALMAQGDEGFDAYYNQGRGRFERRRLLRFPPVYGSNHFELADVDGDGRTDLLYVNGDNADYSPVPKPYHGLRLFLGTAEGRFRERLFLPLHGAVAARVADYDGDGDADLAAIAYFPDYARAPDDGFVLFENQGALTFRARTFEDARRGRWLTLDDGDFDGDGDADLLLGSNIGFAPRGDATGLYARWAEAAPSFLVLENRATPANR